MFTYPYKGACYENLGIMRKNKRKTHSKTGIGREALILDFFLCHYFILLVRCYVPYAPSMMVI